MRAPVLLIIFNRPDTTKVVFEAIKKASPARLYIASDGSRSNVPDDFDKIELTRNIVTQVDWPCEVYTKFEEKNLGCGPGPASAISWIFDHEDRAIIIEDDCVPAQSFFPFCEELLEKYKNDERVWKISGNNFYEDIEMPYSYIFSNYGHSWGWATWRRCWQQFDLKMNKLEKFLNIGGFRNVLLSEKEAFYFNRKYKDYCRNETYFKHIWDVQADFTIKSNRGLSIIPQYNLVKNIGLIGTHVSSGNKYHNREVNENFMVESHPEFILPYQKYDALSFKYHYAENSRFDKYIFRIVKKLIRKIFIG